MQTGRLVLRCYDPEDATALYEAVKTDVDHLARWLPWPERYRVPADALAFIVAFTDGFDVGEEFTYGIFDVSSGRLLGGIGLHRFSPITQRVNIGYWIRQAAEGFGFVTEATGRMVRCAFEDLGVQTVEIRAETTNARSRAVPLRLGFHLDGVLRQVAVQAGELRDHAVYSLLRSEFEQSDPAIFPS